MANVMCFVDADIEMPEITFDVLGSQDIDEENKGKKYILVVSD